MKRSKIFEQARKEVLEFNAQSGNSYTQTLNEFSHLEWSEFEAAYLHPEAESTLEEGAEVYPFDENTLAAPAAIDWTAKGCVTGVKNQGSCGGCWSFAVVGAIESQYLISRGCSGAILLSEQQLIDCDKGSNGCNGGIRATAYNYVQSAGGVMRSGDYPYTNSAGTCRFAKTRAAITITGSGAITPNSEAALKEYVGNRGPCSAGVYVQSSFQRYSGGVYYDASCPTTSTNHAIIVTGYGRDATGGDYWIVKNSWGTGWGKSGYIWIARGRNNCGLSRNPNSITGVRTV
jgi:cathepsin L